MKYILILYAMTFNLCLNAQTQPAWSSIGHKDTTTPEYNLEMFWICNGHLLKAESLAKEKPDIHNNDIHDLLKHMGMCMSWVKGYYDKGLIKNIDTKKKAEEAMKRLDELHKIYMSAES